MKRLMLYLLALLLLTGCASPQAVEEEFPDPISLDSLETPPVQPDWVRPAELKTELRQGLNLDGIGDFDDEVYISQLQFGDAWDDTCTVLQVHLGTGETLARVLPVRGYYTLQTAPLFSQDKQALILEVQAPGSNWGAANLFVYDVFPAGADPVPAIVDRVNTVDSTFYSALDEPLLDASRVTDGTVPINVGGSSLQGLTVYTIGEQGRWREVESTFLWTGDNWGPDNGWSLLED